MNLLKLLTAGRERCQPYGPGPYSASQVADYLIDRYEAEYNNYIQPQATLKLVYFCHAWMLGIHERPLLDKPIDGWQYGPYCHDLYRAMAKIDYLAAVKTGKNEPARFKQPEKELIDNLHRIRQTGRRKTGQPLQRAQHSLAPSLEPKPEQPPFPHLRRRPAGLLPPHLSPGPRTPRRRKDRNGQQRPANRQPSRRMPPARELTPPGEKARRRPNQSPANSRVPRPPTGNPSSPNP